MFIIQQIAYFKRRKIIVGQYIFYSIERAAIGHKSTRHGTPRVCRHVGTRSVDTQSVMERAAPGF